MIAVVHERIDDEVEQFNNGFWSGDVYYDEKKEFYNALGYVNSRIHVISRTIYIILILSLLQRRSAKMGRIFEQYI